MSDVYELQQAYIATRKITYKYFEDYQRDLAHKIDAIAPSNADNPAGASGVDGTNSNNINELIDITARDFHISDAADAKKAEQKEADLEDTLDGNILRCFYPRLPYNTDFETFRKHYKTWKDIIAFYNRPGLEGKTNTEKTKIYRERFVSSAWPRVKDGAFIGDLPKGKHTNNGVDVWGATLLDFYNIYRCPGVRLCTSGNRIAAWMKAHGGSEPEQDPCRRLMLQSAEEPPPRILDVYNAGLFLEALEVRVSRGRVGHSMHLWIERTPSMPKTIPASGPRPDAGWASRAKSDKRGDMDPMCNEDRKDDFENDEAVKKWSWPDYTDEELKNIRSKILSEGKADGVKLPDDDLRLLREECKAKGKTYETGDVHELLRIYEGDLRQMQKDVATLRAQENDRKRKRDTEGNDIASPPKKVNADVDTGASAADAKMDALNDREKAVAQEEPAKDSEDQMDIQVEDTKKSDPEPVVIQPQVVDTEGDQKPVENTDKQVDVPDVKVDNMDEDKKPDGNDAELMDVQAKKDVEVNAEGGENDDDKMEVDTAVEEKGDGENKKEEKKDEGEGEGKAKEAPEDSKKADEGKGTAEPAKQKRFERVNANQTDALYPLDQYPEPWPLRPFSAPLPRLQCQFRPAYLPRKLIVHDPWCITEVSSSRARALRDMEEASYCRWGSKPDSVQVFNLSLTTAHESDYDAFDKAGGNGERAVPEAHLFLSPRRRIGSGHHSFVYQAELELPRGMLIPPRMCRGCTEALWQKAKTELDEMSEDEALREASWPHDIATERLFSSLFKDSLPFDATSKDSADMLDIRFRVLKRMRLPSLPAFCPHLRDQYPKVPPSHRVSVTVKLSVPNDYQEDHEQHLLDEARTYQRFPSSMFEHWTGYNIIHPCRDPTPVGAVCPQFYGYYTPDKNNAPMQDGDYQSAILILEHCGLQISVSGLSLDDKSECLSLIRRLHYASFKHNSLYERNILIQNGPLTAPPWKRTALHRRFRLIDFGRTTRLSSDSFNECTQEVEAALRALNFRYPQMGFEFGV